MEACHIFTIWYCLLSVACEWNTTFMYLGVFEGRWYWLLLANWTFKLYVIKKSEQKYFAAIRPKRLCSWIFSWCKHTYVVLVNVTLDTLPCLATNGNYRKINTHTKLCQLNSPDPYAFGLRFKSFKKNTKWVKIIASPCSSAYRSSFFLLHFFLPMLHAVKFRQIQH